MKAAADTPELPDSSDAQSHPEQQITGKHPHKAEKGKRSIKVVDADAANEEDDLVAVNESLKAMSSDLGETKIEKVDEASQEISIETEQPLSDELADELAAERRDEDRADTLHSEEISPEITPNSEEQDALEETGPDTAERLPEAAKVESDGLPDDDATRAAVDEIIAEESDAVMAAEDLARDLENSSNEPAPKSHHSPFYWIFATSRGRWLFGGALFASLIALAVIPTTRYFMLNAVGVRSSLSLTVIDRETRQPLKNVSVQVSGKNTKTDGEGVARLDDIRLGSTILQIDKRAFSSISRPIIVGWGSNPLGEFEAEAVGSRYTFVVRDFLSGAPIAGATANSGDGDAVSDEEGKLVLTLDTAELDDAATVEVFLSAETYREEKILLPVNNREAQDVGMVPSHKHVFVSKRSGKYDVYAIDADGKNETKLVEGSGIERDDITLVPHQSLNVAALVSSRERVTNTSGYLLSTLYVLNTKDGTLVKIDQSEQIQIIGWSDEGRLLYVKIAAGMSAADTKRHRLMSFNSNDFADIKELATSNSFNDVLMADDRVYFAPSNIFQENSNPGLFVVDPDGKNQQTILTKEVYNIFRSSYDKLDISTGSNWYSHTLGSKDIATASQAPSSQYSRVYADNPSLETSLWVDTRDGKGVLLSYDKKTKEDKIILSRSGLKLPLYWLNNTYVIFRLNDGKETADYIINTEGGEARKIADVTDTNGVDRWYYY